MDVDALRQHFPHTADTIYVNHAATSPLSTPVTEAVEGFMAERQGTDPDAAINNFASFQEVWAATRQQVAELLSTEASRIAYTSNTSSGLNVLARGLDWQPGDRVAVPGCEFPANVYPFMNLEAQGVAVDLIPHEESTFTLKAIEETLTPQTRVLTCSWVQFVSGFRADLDAIGALCDAHDIIFCVDAIQGLGAFSLDVEACGIDFLACGGHKWLMAPQGIGVLYCDPALHARLHPPAGWLHGPVDWSNFYDYALSFHPDARRFEIGTLNNIGIAGLNAALALRDEAGGSACSEQVLACAGVLAEGLEAQGLERYGTSDPAHASGIVTVKANDADGIDEHLNAQNIVGSVRNEMLRLAPTYYNTTDEMEAIVDAVAAFGRTQVGMRR